MPAKNALELEEWWMPDNDNVSQTIASCLDSIFRLYRHAYIKATNKIFLIPESILIHIKYIALF